MSAINNCLYTGTVPGDLKLATVLADFLPISNLSFLSKLLEKVVLNQLQAYLIINSICC